MEQHNFEKKIQQKLGELKIPPSDAVWENVEKNISKRKDRKKTLIFFLLFGSMIVGGYYIVHSTTDHTDSQNQPVSNDVKKSGKRTIPISIGKDSSFSQTAVLPENGSEKNNTSALNTANNKTQHQEIDNKNVERKNVGEPVAQANRSLAVVFDKKNTKWVEPIDDNKQTSPDSKQTNSQKNGLDINGPEKIQEKEISIIADGIENIQSTNIESQNELATTNKIMTVAITADTKKDFSRAANSSTIKMQKRGQSHKWKLGITFSGGTSMIGGGGEQGVNNLSPLVRMDFVTFPASNYMFSSVSNYFRPSPIKNSMAFLGGVYLEKNISRKNKIDLGISYKYYSLINTTGNKIDFNIDPSLSGNDIYSSWSNINTYRNNFHYIEIPVSVKFQLGNSKSLPFYWSVGANISQLISSNSLQFKSSPGLYYNDNSLYNKTQVGLQTGFSAVLFAETKVPIGIGPYFIYNTSKLANEGLYGGKHFSFIGIKAEILLGKK